MKKILSYSLTVLMAIAFYQLQAQEEQIHFTQENTIIVWDLHGVVLKTDGYAMACEFWRCNHKCNILWNTFSTCVHLARTFGLRKTSFEEIVRACEPVNQHLATLMRTMSYCQKIIPGTAAIIEELHAARFTHAIASNIGIKTFESIKQQNEQFFNHFSDVTTSDTIDPSGSLIRKPNPQFFALYQQLHNKTGKQIIFIDDDRSNVQAAQKEGMRSILFKNPKQLRLELQKIKLLSVV